MTNNKAITGFTIDAMELLKMHRIRRTLNKKTKSMDKT